MVVSLSRNCFLLSDDSSELIDGQTQVDPVAYSNQEGQESQSGDDKGEIISQGEVEEIVQQLNQER